MNNQTLLITELSTSTGKEIYYTDLSVMYWFLGAIIILLCLVLIKRR